LSQIKFTQSTQTKRASLEIDLPDRPSTEVAMDKPIEFFVLVYPREESQRFEGARTRQWTEDAIEELGVGYARLELVPRGRGELLVRAPLLYHSIIADEQVNMTINLFNEGSDRIDNIELTADLPLNWTKVITPANVRAIEIGEEKQVEFTFIPPNDVPEGRYEIRLRARGTSNSQPVNGEDKTVTVEIRSETNVIGATFIVMLLLGTVGGMVVFGVKLSRR